MNYIGIGAVILLVIMEVAMYIIVRMTNQRELLITKVMSF